jgi:hypothetical protein
MQGDGSTRRITMLLTTHLPELRLADGQVARLQRAAGTRLEARDGHLWITLDGDLDDRVLDAGDAWTVPNAGDVIVSAFRGDAILVLRTPDGRTPCASVTLTNDDDGGRIGRWLSRFGVPLGDVL